MTTSLKLFDTCCSLTFPLHLLHKFPFFLSCHLEALTELLLLPIFALLDVVWFKLSNEIDITVAPNRNIQEKIHVYARVALAETNHVASHTDNARSSLLNKSPQKPIMQTLEGLLEQHADVLPHQVLVAEHLDNVRVLVLNNTSGVDDDIAVLRRGLVKIVEALIHRCVLRPRGDEVKEVR